MHFIFYGPEGSGKGTQAELLAKKLHLPIFTSGDLVREACKNDKGIIGEVCRKSLEVGHYVPDTEMFVLWKRRLKQEDAKQGWILDGFPRNISQAKFLHGKIKKYGYKVDKVFYLKISDSESMKRLLARKRKLFPGSNKNHDTKKRIKERLDIYHKNEPKVVEFYKKQGILEEVDGEKSVATIHQDIEKRAKG